MGLSDIARRKIKRIINFAGWDNWTDEIKIKKISRIISNARKRVRGKIKRMMLREARSA